MPFCNVATTFLLLLAFSLFLLMRNMGHQDNHLTAVLEGSLQSALSASSYSTFDPVWFPSWGEVTAHQGGLVIILHRRLSISRGLIIIIKPISLCYIFKRHTKINQILVFIK